MSQKLWFLFLCICLFQSCDKAALLSIDDLEKELPFPFELSINVNHCIDGGSLLFVAMPNPELYGYLWEVDGKHGGHDYATFGCQCIENATVRVTRLTDGHSIKQSIGLTNRCSLSNADF